MIYLTENTMHLTVDCPISLFEQQDILGHKIFHLMTAAEGHIRVAVHAVNVSIQRLPLAQH